MIAFYRHPGLQRMICLRSHGATWMFAGVLFAVFFAYYLHLTQYLSYNGGPDEEPHIHAAKFLTEHGRLAVYPDDEERLYFSSHGTTRSFRPPLAYINGAVGAHLLDRIGLDREVPYRMGSAMLAALGVMIVFLAAITLTGSTWLALFSAMSFGFMPQFTFLSAYFNDDVGAVMVAALLLYCVILLAVHGVSRGLLLLTGLAAGLVVLAKPSAWAVAVGLMSAAVWLIARSDHGILRGLTTLAIGALITGGWWLAFNMINHGLHDPLNLVVERELVAKYRDLVPGTGRSYAEQGFDAVDLLMNRDDFLGKTFKSMVGHLGWLRLEMGSLQYTFYGAILVVALVGWLYGFAARDNRIEHLRSLSVLFFAAVLLQFAAYQWANLVRDAQPQGRYLLPAMPIVIAMMSLGACWMLTTLRRLLPGQVTASRPARMTATCLVLAAPLYIHLQGFVHYVIPFYKPAYYYGLHASQFEPWRPDWAQAVETSDLEFKVHRGATIAFSGGNDPWITFSDDHSEPPAGSIMLRVTLDSDANDHFSVYWDEGAGMSESLSARVHYNIGHQTIYLVLDMDDPELIRLDPLTRKGQVTIYEIAYAPITKPPLSVSRFIRQMLWCGHS